MKKFVKKFFNKSENNLIVRKLELLMNKNKQ